MRLIKISLWLTVFYNLSAAAMLLFPSSGPGQSVGMPTEVPTIYLVTAAYFVLAFGGAYLWMALQDHVVRSLLYFGAFAKSGAFLMVWSLWALGEVTTPSAILVLGDAAFAVVWFTWLRKNPVNGSARTSA